jgi:hypothetical protein
MEDSQDDVEISALFLAVVVLRMPVIVLCASWIITCGRVGKRIKGVSEASQHRRHTQETAWELQVMLSGWLEQDIAASSTLSAGPPEKAQRSVIYWCCTLQRRT